VDKNVVLTIVSDNESVQTTKLPNSASASLGVLFVMFENQIAKAGMAVSHLSEADRNVRLLNRSDDCQSGPKCHIIDLANGLRRTLDGYQTNFVAGCCRIVVNLDGPSSYRGIDTDGMQHPRRRFHGRSRGRVYVPVLPVCTD
jgi:hypothetical protein